MALAVGVALGAFGLYLQRATTCCWRDARCQLLVANNDDDDDDVMTAKCGMPDASPSLRLSNATMKDEQKTARLCSRRQREPS